MNINEKILLLRKKGLSQGSVAEVNSTFRAKNKPYWVNCGKNAANFYFKCTKTLFWTCRSQIV